MNNLTIDNDIDQNSNGLESGVDSSLFDRIKRITSVSEVLRIFGACAVIASLSLFMLEGWSEGNDINRYLKLLGQTGLLTIAGLLLSFVVKEFKGARLFFGLGLVSAVTNFTILGALIYSIVPLDGLLGYYPKAVTWAVGSSSQFLIVCIGACALLTVLARFSYSIFARKIAGSLTLAFLGLNALLLMPLRGPLAVSVLTIIALLVATTVVKTLSNKSDLVSTPETKFAFATLFLPGLIIVGRSLSLYHVDELFLLTLCGLVYYALRVLIMRANVESEYANNKLLLVSTIQYCLGFVMAILVTMLLPHWMDDFGALSFSLIVIAFTADQLMLGRNRRAGKAMLTLSTTIVVAINVVFAFASPLLAVTLASLAVCIGSAVFSSYALKHVNNNSASFLIALFGTVITFLLMVFKLIAWIDMSNWMTIGLTGMLLIVIGSCYERFGLKLPSLKTEIKSSDKNDDGRSPSTPTSLNI